MPTLPEHEDGLPISLGRRSMTKVNFRGYIVLALGFVLLGCGSLFYREREIDRHELTDIEVQFISTEYELVYKIEELPTGIITILNKWAPGIVNPGKPFNLSDKYRPNLSFSQLTWAGTSTDTVFVLYIQGGYAPYQCLLIARFEAGRVVSSLVLGFQCFTADIDTLKDFVRSGKTAIINKPGN